MLAMPALLHAASYSLNSTNCSAAKGDASPWSFSNGFSITNTAGKGYGAGKDGCIKFSVGVQYTIVVPDGVSITKMTVTGYDNYDTTDGYLAEVNGATYSATDYVFPQKDTQGNYTIVSHTITFQEPVSGAITFTPAGKQIVLQFKLTDTDGDDTSATESKFDPSTFVYPTPTSQMEKLDRGTVALKNAAGTGYFVSWRLLGTEDPATTTFDLLKDGTTIAQGLTTTCYDDANATAPLTGYQVVARTNGEITATASAVMPWSQAYTLLQLNRPATGANGGTYTPNDCSVGDVDGDGVYELFVKWDPSNSKDNSQKGTTDNVIIDCYKQDGTQLWRVDLGPNIRAGAHYTQHLVYDFDGDGRAEMICKTAPGTIDSQGQYITAAADDADITAANNTAIYRNSNGYVNDGPEYLTVFDGLTGRAVHTVFYNPNRAGTLGGAPTHPDKAFWGDSYGGRADRYLATVAYLGGPQANPSAVMCRGYYTRAYLWAVDFDGQKLTTRWLHASTSATAWSLTTADGTETTNTETTNTAGLSTSYTAYANGNHNIACGDIDGDGCDEIVHGSCAIDHDGNLLYATGYGHGDAVHLGKFNPDRNGYQVFQVHEEKAAGYGWDLHDAATGEILHAATGSGDNGRGIIADVVETNSRGYEFSSSNDRSQRNAKSGEVTSTKNLPVNFRIYWDGDLLDEMFDGKYSSTDSIATPVIQKVSGTILTLTTLGVKPQTCNTTKATPCLQADLLGDWREEIICWNYDDPSQLIICSTNTPTEYTIPTLMHDHLYRIGITWQQSAYNQPPYPGYYLPDYITWLEYIKAQTGIQTAQAPSPAPRSTAYYNLMGQRVNHPAHGIYIHNHRKIILP